MAYTNKGRIQNFLNVDIASAFDTYVAECIAAAQAWIEKYVGKSFEAVSETRYYDGNGKSCLLIDPLVGTATILILREDGTTDATLTEGAGEDYLLYPLNATEKNEIRMTDYSSFAAFPTGKRRVQITATFGAATSVPEAIQIVATKLAAKLIEPGLKGGTLTETTLGDYTAKFQTIDEKADAMGIFNTLDQYRDITL